MGIISKDNFNLVKLEIRTSFYKSCLSYIPEILKVFKKWDNKKITIRIEKDLNNLNTDKRFYFRKNYGNWSLSAIEKDRYIRHGVTFEEFYFLICYNNEDKTKYDYVNYTQIEKYLLKRKESYYNDFFEQEQTIKNLDSLIEERNNLITAIEKNTKQLQSLSYCYNGTNFINDRI